MVHIPADLKLPLQVPGPKQVHVVKHYRQEVQVVCAKVQDVSIPRPNVVVPV